jgi:peptidoglycan/xylan/chitin deacetylase (PgdA/CDA1 family)
VSGTVILNFHGIGTPRRELEPGEGPWWISVDLFRAILDLVAEAERPAAITFDDGNASDLDIAAPELAARGLTAEVFALTGRLGRKGSLSEAGLRELEAAGLRVGTHGVDHVDWRRVDAATLAREISESRARLGEILDREIDAAAIPFGSYGPHVLRALRRAGLARVYTSDGGAAGAGAWLRPRNSVRAGMDLAAVRAILSGEEAFGRRLRRAAAMRWKRGLAE